MDRCRICLAHTKRLNTIFEDAGLTTASKMYSEMITSIANVRVSEGDGLPDKICRSCRKKVHDAYQLKNLIERTHNGYELNAKRLNFNNISDIKIEIDLFKVENDENKPDNIAIPDSFSASDSVVYNDTTIQKVKIEKEPIHILDFLEQIKEEGSDFDNNESYFADSHQYGSDNSDEYDVPLLKRLKKIKRKKKGRKRKCERDEEYSPGPLDADDEEYIPGCYYTKKAKKKANDPPGTKKKPGPKPKRALKQVLIKPEYLRDIGTVPSTPRPTTRKKLIKDSRTKLQLCPHCGKQTKTLKSHILIHIGERKFKCDQCSKSYFDEGHLKKHMVIHGGTKSYKCDQCVAAFYTVASLRSHKLVHSVEKKFVCDVCSKAFKRKNACARHVNAHNSANKNIKCELCNMSFFSRGGLKHHMRIHTGERPFKCELCAQPYSYKHDFNRHCLNKHGIFLKRRKVYVMNEQVLLREREMMKDVVRRAQGILNEGESINPFESEGPTSYLAFMQAVKALQNNQIKIPIDISY